jgi:molecular chaperone GrpE
VIDALGKPFDPNQHEAIAYEPCAADQDGMVVAELQKGYMLRDKVLRPAIVKVGQATK